MCWRKRTVVRSVVVVQVFVAACVLSLWQLQREQQREEQQQWLAQQEAPKRVGKYMILFKVPSVLPTGGISYLSSRERDGTVPLEDVLQDGVEKVAPGAEKLIAGGRVRRTDLLPVWDGGEGELLERGEGTMRKSNGGQAWKEGEKDEEDPDVARGFLDEYVSHRSDGNSFLMVDDDYRNLKTTRITPSDNDSDSATRDGGRQREVNSRDSSSYRSPALETDESVEDDAGEMDDYKFKQYDRATPFTMTMRDDQQVYFQDVGSATCFIEGTDIEGSVRGGQGGCRCLEGYFGVDCGIPEAAWFDTYRNKFPETRLRRREVPRRVINGLTVNHEFAMFEARLHELHPVVDVFIVAESNYSAHGDPKGFSFLKRLRRGYMRPFQDKLLYVSLDTFPDASRSSGWMADAYLRFHLGAVGIPLLKGLRDDDLFVLSDADELPTREVITFLKVYDGYPEPISFALQWNVFGFFWKVPAEDSWTNWVKRAEEGVSAVSSVATIGMLKKVLFNNVFLIRRTGLWQYYEVFKKLKTYREDGHLVKEWVMGKAGHYAGWHCSWCFSPVNIVVKMDSAQADDQPRWGDMPEKKNLTYIASRISQGVWFDDKEHYLPVRNPKQKHYAPRYLLEHPSRYRSLLYHPSHALNLGQPWAPP